MPATLPPKNPVQEARSPLPRFRIYTRTQTYRTVLQALLTGQVQAGQDVGLLERDLGRRFAVAHVVATAQARLGLYLAIKGAVRPGRTKVIVSPYTIFDVINMVVAAGGDPVFADIERETCNIDPRGIAPLIDEQTAAVMVTHLHGLAVDMDQVLAACAPRGIPVIEDAAQAFGTMWNGRPVGSIGHAGVVSFGMYKNITGFFGGALMTADAALEAAARRELAAFPQLETGRLLKRVREGLTTDIATWPPLFRAIMFKVFRLGSLYDIAALNQRTDPERDPTLREQLPEHYHRRITPLQARLVRQYLPRVDAEIHARIAIARIYAEELAGVRGLIAAPFRTDLTHTYNYFTVQVPNRRDVLHGLLRRGRDLAQQHIRNTADLPCFERWKRDCPNARATAEEVLLLPTYPRYGGDQAIATARALRQVVGDVNG
jgi:dTDP-4-amino-4,6-dideoxygalactose transaminase